MHTAVKSVRLLFRMLGYRTHGQAEQRVLEELSKVDIRQALFLLLEEHELKGRFSWVPTSDDASRDEPLSLEERSELIPLLPVTKGASTLLAGMVDRRQFLHTASNDKGFRSFMREYASSETTFLRIKHRLRALANARFTNLHTEGSPKVPNRNVSANLRSHNEEQQEKFDEAFSKLRFDKDQARVRKKISELYRQKEYNFLVWCYDNIDKRKKNASNPFKFYLLYFVSRIFLSMNASDTAFNILKQLLGSRDLLESVEEKEIIRANLALSQAAVRSGRVSDAQEILEMLLIDNFQNWEVHYNIGLLHSVTCRPIALAHFDAALSLRPDLPANAAIYIAEVLREAGQFQSALQVLIGLQKRATSGQEYLLGLANLHGSQGFDSSRRRFLAAYFNSFGLASQSLMIVDERRLFGIGAAEPAVTRDHPLVTVIMTAFNAASTLESAVQSVLEQTYGNLELIVVDDVSSDATPQILADLQARDQRIKVLRNGSNVGTYSSKNRAIEIARGEYITCHDSDDWMHPQRIEHHIAQITNQNPANYSKWIRMEHDRHVVVRRGGPYIHDNPASTFIRREVFDRIGFFDAVRTGADSEFLYRIRNTYGQNSVGQVDLPLALGLYHNNSLTSAGVAAFDEHRFSAVRLAYWESWVWWQLRNSISGAKLHIPMRHKKRLFSAPEGILS